MTGNAGRAQVGQLLGLGHSEEPSSRLEKELISQAALPQHGEACQAAVERATGVVMALGRLDAVQAGLVLSDVCRRTGIALSRVADLLTVWAPTGELNLGLRIALEEAIRDQHRGSPTGARPAPEHRDDRKLREGEGRAVPHA